MRNPFDTMSPRAIRVIYLVAAAIVLLVSSINFHNVMFVRPPGNDQCRWTMERAESSRLIITEIVRGGVAERAGLRNGDILLQIDGRTFRSDLHAQTMINRVAGDSATYTVERAGQVFETRILILRFVNMSYLAVALYGFGFFLIGLVVVLARPQGKVQRMFARYGLLSLLFCSHLFSNLNPQIEPEWQIQLFGAMFVIAGVFGPPTFVRFFLNFPIRLQLAESRVFGAVLYGAAAILTFLVVYGVGRYPTAVINTLVLTRFAFVGFGLTFFLYSYFRYVRTERRKALRPILLGIAAVFAAFVYMLGVAAIDPFSAFINPLVLLPALLLPVGAFLFGYAIIRYRLMDMHLILKRSLMYGIVTALIAVVYILTVYGAGTLLSSLVGEQENEVVVIIALVVIAFVFDPLKRSVQDLVDRSFYRERHRYQKALLEFAEELPRQINMEQILRSMVHRLTSTMHLEGVAVIVCDDRQGCISVEENIPRSCCIFSEEEPGGLFPTLKSTRQPQSLALMAEDPKSVRITEPDKQRLLKGGVVLSVPLFLQDRFIGAINVGPKRSGEIFTEEDVGLLQTVAAQAAVAIENARLHGSELEKEKIQEELTLARRIQEGLLPRAKPDVKGLDIEAVSLPALTVGGDYYDFIRLSPTRLLVVVADVSGKGMSAALYMSKVQGMIQLASHMYRSPREMLVHVNRRIFEGMERRSFITMALALFDTKARNVRVCRAGHNPVIVGSGRSVRSVTTPGIGLGLEPGRLFEKTLRETVIPLSNDAVFLFYTDGLTEAMNGRREEFGEAEVLKIVQQHRNGTARGLVDGLLASVRRFQGSAERHDDLTVVAVKPAASRRPRRRAS